MANFVENELRVTGSPSLREEFLNHATGVDEEGKPLVISFSALLPVPTEETDALRWCQDHWGVKGEIIEWMGFERTRRSITAAFATNGSPPLSLFETVSKRFPDLTFRLRYWDETGGYAGLATFRAGDMQHVERELPA